MAYDFDPNTALLYIEKRFRLITQADYYQRRHRLTRSPVLQELLDKHNSIGFVLEHEEMRHGIKLAVKRCSRELFHEANKKDNDKYAIAALAKSLNDLTLTWKQLNIDMPYVSAMKEELEKARAIIANKHNPNMGGKTINITPAAQSLPTYPATAMVVEPNTIAGKVSDSPDSEGHVDQGDDQIFD
jgi:hypothetical protein